ncbi:hypothetical protein GCM10025882_01810 [Acinetobacter gyllenbergii]|uniref:DUF3298 domain-containing protein n=1 Tax=Acinetobacter gyllenbergii CIP 110306 = MTCC 11365 TaxID=1217657 RepID=A0A829HDI4_9GAMM|nr:hypothetical protein [Acinetobacter gyllenbergii]EPF75008.1 hypothetical protein F957_03204 [Acinetobacter gyllenbergii CIP 110306 = MTCC 11365]EPH32570.1 hypothetical protein L293_1354 [Acinetobacter gyllenbergii CIP 110306 = MTCC 11365]ESK41748.1 hypothetical protein F987_02493 [Acinetobacter gyllenbergii NIPH 230]GMA09757.1 hypothetical protein GCM10025882_01810 [Acinetobacter gyllenbergii]
MNTLKPLLAISMMIGIMALTACDHPNKNESTKEQTKEQAASSVEKAEVLPYLNMKEAKADYALPFCEKKNCIDLDIQTVKTQDEWLNAWIAKNQANVIQQQIEQNKNLTLQQAINAYVKKSDEWQDKYSKNKAYELHLTTRIASQRNQYVLLQVGVDTQQEDIAVKDRFYFFVADRKLQKSVSVLDVIQKNQQNALNQIIQSHYQTWVDKQSAEVKKQVPKKLYWGQADWFFDGEGIGVHYRANEISKDAPQLDIYLTTEQSKQMLQAEIYQQMF